MLPLNQNPAPREREDEQWSRDYERRIVEWAVDRIRGHFRDVTWQAFRRTAIDGQPARQVAAELGLSVGAVYLAKARVLKRLQQCVARIDDHPSWYTN